MYEAANASNTCGAQKALIYAERPASVFQHTEQPDGNKVPDAMLKMSLAFEKTDKTSEAKNMLLDLTKQYPSTNAGRLGAQRLENQ